MSEANEANLISDLLYNASASGNRTLEKRLADTCVWFYKNRERIPFDNLAARQAFLQKAFWTMLEVNALLLERIHELEDARRSKALWLPRGVRLNHTEEFA